MPCGADGGSAAPLAPSDVAPLRDDGDALRVILAPDLPRFEADAVERLLSAPFHVAPMGDRTGVRFAGPPPPRRDADDGVSMPMVLGALQVSRSGEVIVLGADHPTTGGYPVVAVLARVDRGPFFARRPFAAVRFRSVTAAEARAAYARPALDQG